MAAITDGISENAVDHARSFAEKRRDLTAEASINDNTALCRKIKAEVDQRTALLESTVDSRTQVQTLKSKFMALKAEKEAAHKVKEEVARERDLLQKKVAALEVELDSRRQIEARDSSLMNLSVDSKYDEEEISIEENPDNSLDFGMSPLVSQSSLARVLVGKALRESLEGGEGESLTLVRNLSSELAMVVAPHSDPTGGITEDDLFPSSKERHVVTEIAIPGRLNTLQKDRHNEEMTPLSKGQKKRLKKAQKEIRQARMSIEGLVDLDDSIETPEPSTPETVEKAIEEAKIKVESDVNVRMKALQEAFEKQKEEFERMMALSKENARRADAQRAMAELAANTTKIEMKKAEDEANAKIAALAANASIADAQRAKAQAEAAVAEAARKKATDDAAEAERQRAAAKADANAATKRAADEALARMAADARAVVAAGEAAVAEAARKKAADDATEAEKQRAAAKADADVATKRAADEALARMDAEARIAAAKAEAEKVKVAEEAKKKAEIEAAKTAAKAVEEDEDSRALRQILEVYGWC
jgi:hypothetical protein